MRSRSGKSRGWIGEELAAQYLEGQGYDILGRNVRYGRGELDIVCRDRGEIVFVEVKTRRSFAFGVPEESITPRQEKMLKYTASGYLQENVKELTPTRFDLVAVVETADAYTINHVKDALTG